MTMYMAAAIHTLNRKEYTQAKFRVSYIVIEVSTSSSLHLRTNFIMLMPDNPDWTNFATF